MREGGENVRWTELEGEGTRGWGGTKHRAKCRHRGAAPFQLPQTWEVVHGFSTWGRRAWGNTIVWRGSGGAVDGLDVRHHDGHMDDAGPLPCRMMCGAAVLARPVRPRVVDDSDDLSAQLGGQVCAADGLFNVDLCVFERRGGGSEDVSIPFLPASVRLTVVRGLQEDHLPARSRSLRHRYCIGCARSLH